MFKKFILSCLWVGLAFSSSGCAALVAGGGTALWQGGKVISEEVGTRDQVAAAVRKTFKSRKIVLTDDLKKAGVIQLRGDDSSGTKFAVDVFETGPKTVRIEVRVGLGEKVPARDLLTEIKKRL